MGSNLGAVGPRCASKPQQALDGRSLPLEIFAAVSKNIHHGLRFQQRQIGVSHGVGGLALLVPDIKAALVKAALRGLAREPTIAKIKHPL